ncbi:MAG: hypothetical protein QE487_02005 [Fluviicola sp.]|nr:hypothetical protein [Fluviicola sp.]
MKSIFTFTFILFFNLTFVAQITVNPNSIVESDGSKTIFVYRQADEANLDQLTKILDDNWDYNEIELKSIDEFADYEMKVNDFLFMINYDYLQTYSTYTDGSSGPTSNFVDFYLTLSQKTEKAYTQLSRSSLSISGETIFDVCRTDKEPKEIIYNQYKSSTVFSWNYVYLATIMKTVSTNLQDSKSHTTLESNNSDLKGLKEQKLYIADAIEIKQNRFNGSEKTIDYEATVDKEYDYTYEIVSTEKLNELIVSGEKGYVFMFQKVGHGKVSIVIDLSTLEIIYHDVVKGNYAFDKKDIKTLNKMIAKSTN